MKKYVVLIIAAIVTAATAYMLPTQMADRIPRVELIYPTKREYSQDIAVSGTVEELTRTEITLPVPVVIQEVQVSVGDHVEANQLLAIVDTASTKTAYLNFLETVDALPEEYAQSITILENLLAEHGLSNLSDIMDDQIFGNLIPVEIRAPASGIVTTLSLQSGAITTYNTAVGTISDPNSLRLRMSVNEVDADRVQEGDPVVFRAAATGSSKYAGTVARVFPAATQTISGLSQQTVVGLYVAPQGDTSRLKPGYSVNGVVRKGSATPVLILPYEAILQDDANREYVYVYENYRVKKQIITTGEELGWGVVITGGLSENEIVVSNASVLQSEGLAIPQTN